MTYAGYVASLDYNTQGSSQNYMQVGQEVHVVKGDGEDGATSKRPLFVLKESQPTTTTNGAHTEQEEEDEEADEASDFIFDAVMESDDGDEESSDDSADSDEDDLQAYLASAHHAKAIQRENKSAARVTQNKKDPKTQKPKDVTKRQIETTDKMDSKHKPKRKIATLDTKNKKIRNK